MKKTNLLTKTLLVAASLLSVAPAAKAYDKTGWNTDENYVYGFDLVGAYGSYSGSPTLYPLIPAIRAGVYNVRGVDASWYGNDYGDYFLGIKTGVSPSYMENWMDLGLGYLHNPIAFNSANGNHSMLGGYSTINLLPLNATYVLYHYRYDQTDEQGNFYASDLAYFERGFQVARTGPGFSGASATSAFALDNQSYGSNYGTYSNFNVLRTESFFDGEGYTAATVGSVVRNGDIKLGNLGVQDGLYAKDAGWLDIRGSLTISSTYGQIYIRDAEITSTVFEDKINYTNDADRTQNAFYFESGILSVRDYFAQDMFVRGNQTVAFRDGAVNSNDIFIDGLGYSAAGGAHGSLRSISGNNVQNGDIGIGWLTGGDGRISVDVGSTLTINGTINGVNGAASAGGSSLIYNVAGNLIQNGTIASGVANVTKASPGDVRLNVANSFGGNVYIDGGSITVGHLGALSSNGYTQVNTNGTLQFDLGDSTSSTFSELIYMNGTSPSDEATLRVVSGNVTLNNLVINNQEDYRVATFQTNSGTSLTVDGGEGFDVWHTDAGVRFNTATNSSITTSTDFLHTGILKDGAGLLHLYGSNFSGGIRATAGSVVFHANSDTGQDGGLNYTFGYNSGVSSGASFVLQAASNNPGVGIALGNFEISGNGDTSNSYSGAIHNAVGDNDVGTITLAANSKIFAANNSILSIGAITSPEENADLNITTDSSGTIPTLLTSPVTFTYGTVYSGDISSSVGVVTKNGAGYLILNGNSSAVSSVNPNIVLNSGVTLVETANGLRGTNGITRVNAGASLIMNSSAAVVGTVQIEGTGFGLTPDRLNTLRSLTFNGASNSNADIVLLGAGPATIGKIAASTTATSAGTISATTNAGVNFYVDAGRLNVSGDIASSVGAINKYGVGTTLGISGDILTTANLTVNEGILALSGTAASLNVSVVDGATLQINANNVFYNSTSGGETVVNVASGGNLILGSTGTVTDTIYNLTGSGTIQLLNASVLNVLKGNFAGGVNSTGELIKDQEGGSPSTLLLTGDSTYQGGTTVREGVLNVANTGSLTSNAVVQSGGILVVNGRIKSDSDLSIGGNVTVQNGGELKGSGTIEGNVDNSGDVGPGNSPGILTVAGDYTATAGWLNLELADNAGVAGTSHDQLRVGGDIDVANTLSANYSTINFIDYNDFAAVRGDVFQVIADLNGDARNTLNKFDLVNYVTAVAPNNDRILFDHSSGRAYGTSLTEATGTFRDYGVTANQKEIGRALWMESISYDKSDYADENFASTALNPVAAAAKTGRKAFILTSNAGLGAGEQATDLGLAAVGVLIAPNAGAALDSLSPEAYAGIADQGTKVARNFVRQTFVVRHRDGATDDWDFEVGYANDELTSKGTSGYNSYATKSNQVTLSASRTIGKEFAVTVAVGSDDGRVTAQNFNTKVKTGTVGLGLTYSPESKIGRFDIAAAVSTADWDSSRGGALASEDGQHSLSAGARFTLAPIATNGVTISPYVGVIYSRSRVKGFTESEVEGTVQLEVDDFRQQSLQSELGLTVDYQLSPQMVLTGLASWEHEFRSSGQTTLNSQFIETGVDDTSFIVNSNGFGTNLYRIGLSLRYDITALSSASISANAILGKGVDTGRELRANYSVRF